MANQTNVNDFLRAQLTGQNAPLIALSDSVPDAPTIPSTAAPLSPALTLAAAGISAALSDDFATALDNFSQAHTLSPNYFFAYLLALCHYQLGDLPTSLTLLEDALTQIRANQPLDDDISTLAQDTDFVANFYTLYLAVLLSTDNLSSATTVAIFLLDQTIVTDPARLISFAQQFKILADTSTAAAFSKAALAYISSLPGGNDKNQLLSSLHQVVKNN